MIPKLVHRIWLGEKPVPSIYEGYWLAWRRQHPGYTFKTWRDSDFDKSFRTSKKIAEAQGMARKADIASYEILHKHGGIYLDCDVMPYHHLDWQKLEGEAIVCNEADSDEFCSHAIMAAAPANAIFARATDTLVEMPINVQPPNKETGPFFFRRMLDFGPYTKLHKEAFYPYDSNEPFVAIFGRDLAGTYGIHVWKGSWINEQDMILNILDRLHWGDLSEAASLASEMSAGIRKMVMDYVEVVSKARTACVAATGHAFISKYLKIKSTNHFEFLKCAFYLLEKETNAVIWQINAGDGILESPLRPLVVNCDPSIVMMEPNPRTFERLKGNYARNQNITFIETALGSTSRTMELHTGSPDKQQEAHKISVMSVAQLLASTDNQIPTIMVVGEGGMDGELMTSILSSGMRPKIIQYQTQTMPKSEQDALTAQLGNDYVLVSFSNYRVAYRTDFFLLYCNDLYIKHGMPTIYEDALKLIVKK